MDSKVKTKVVFIIFITFLMLSLFNVIVYAADYATDADYNTKFSLLNNSVDVDLNGSKYLSFTGGSGSITWTSSEPTIATVENGTVRGLKIGSATITATRGDETSSCTVNVVYNSLNIGGNQGEYASSVNLILGEHPSETLFAKVKDGNFTEVSNPNVTWVSSDTSIVTVDKSKGTITAVKPGTAKITATAAGVSDSCNVNVYAAPTFTDFSKAKYETSLDWNVEKLKVTGIKPSSDNNYYYIITPNNSKPNIIKNDYGALDSEKMSNSLERFMINSDEKYIYTYNISKYAELNQDMYIWILQEEKLENYYYDTNGTYISFSTKFVDEGKKITRAELPKLNLILQNFSIGYWNSTTTNETDNYTYIKFNFPSDTENRKFNIKVGKVTDKSILTKIKNNDYTGITELLTYAKNNNSIYSQTLTTTSPAYFRSDAALFDGRKLLENKAYYYIYVEFDDENGKYYPIEGITLGQAWFSTVSNSWDLWAYTKSDFKWDNLSSTPTDTAPKKEDSLPATPEKKEDTTTASGKLPQTGISMGISLAIVVVLATCVFVYSKYNKLKGI